MSLKKIEQVKKDRGFKLFDLIIYGVIVLLVAALFIAVFATRNKDPLTGVRIYSSAEIIFEYKFGEEPETFSDKATYKEDGDGITVTVDDGGEHNVIYINKSERTVKMTEANCRGKQCLYFKEIDDNNSFIYCNPHRLKIEPYFKDLDNPNIIF